MQRQFINKNEGSITVFVSLMILTILTLLLVCYEKSRIEIAKSRSNIAVNLAINNTLADYNIDMKERYHILALDETYNGKGSEMLITKIYENLDYSFNPELLYYKNALNIFDYKINNLILTDKVYLSDYNADVIRYEIKSYMKYKEIKDFTSSVLSLVNNNKNTNVDNIKQELSNSENRYNIELQEKIRQEEEKKNNTEENNTEEVIEINRPEITDPRDGLRRALKGGVLNYLLDGKDISKVGIVMLDFPSSNYNKINSKIYEDVDIENITGINKALSKQEIKEIDKTSLITESFSIAYIFDHFKSLINNENLGDTRFNYEIEYLIQGKNNDYDNLKGVINKIIITRFTTNMVYIMTDNEKINQALIISSGLFGWTGIPGLVEMGKFLLLSALSYGETLIEVKHLIKGNEIPIIKTYDNWNLDLDSLVSFGSQQVKTSEEKGITYNDFLTMFLLMQDSNLKYYRMLDLMQLNIQMINSEFYIKNLLYSYSLDVSLGIKRKIMKVGDNDYIEINFSKNCSY